MPNKFYSLPKSVFEYYHAKLKDWVRAVLPTKTSDLTNDSDFLDQLALAGIIASNFSTSSTYAVGDYVLYNHTLYRCKTAISTAGAWDSSKWDATKTQDIFQGSAPGLVPAAESGDADKVLKGDGTWGEAGSSVRVSYDSTSETLHLDFSPIPTSITIGDKEYPVVQIGNQLWLAKNLDYKWSSLQFNQSINSSNPSGYYYNLASTTRTISGQSEGMLYNPAGVSSANNLDLPNGWRVPTKSDFSELFSYVNSCYPQNQIYRYLTLGSGWNGYYSDGTNDLGFNWVHNGRIRYNYGWGWDDPGNVGFIGYINGGSVGTIAFNSGSLAQISYNDNTDNSYLMIIRLVKNLT